LEKPACWKSYNCKILHNPPIRVATPHDSADRVHCDSLNGRTTLSPHSCHDVGGRNTSARSHASCWPSIWPTGVEVPHRRCSRRACGARATTCDSLGGRDGRLTSLKHGHGGGGGELQEGARVVRPRGRRPYLRGGGCGYEKGRERTTGLEVRR
jgi:hypothetical protein